MSTIRKLGGNTTKAAAARRKQCVAELKALRTRTTTAREFAQLGAMVVDLEETMADSRLSGAQKDQRFRNILTRRA
jgi:hypothetical protein